MREVMANDRARHNILPLSKFGLMQITRQRVRPALDLVTTEECPSCFGKGIVQRMFPLDDGSAIKVTIAKYFTPKGNDIHKVGIKPDVEVELDTDAYRESKGEKDNQLQSAIDNILEKLGKKTADSTEDSSTEDTADSKDEKADSNDNSTESSTTETGTSEN